MDLQAARKKYGALRSASTPDTNDRLAYDKVLISLDNTEDINEARGFVQADLENSLDADRREIYQAVLADLA